MIPKREAQSGLPVVLFADGLDQANPRIDILAWAQQAQQQQQQQQRLGEAVLVVPAFRGRTLIYAEMSSDAEGDVYREMAFDAEGDFCDAYDGATDDAIAFLNVAAAEIPQADFSRLMVRGPSRGGNVALLLGERDDRVAVVAAQSAPTDFYRKEVYDHHYGQYRCQFLTGKTEEQSRQRMLASSPLRFPLKPGVARVYIDHGEQDTVAPLWNALEMVSHLEAQQVDVQFHSYPGYGHTDLGNSSEFNGVQGEIYESFLAQ
jgi:pimeloyl-ACP methyl ester carboxylesterase